MGERGFGSGWPASGWTGSDWTGSDWTGAWQKWMSPGSRSETGSDAGGPAAGIWGSLMVRLVSAVKERVLGRRLTVPTRTGDVDFTLSEVDTVVDPSLLAMGRMDDVTLGASDLTWNQLTCARAVATMRNVHLRGTGSPDLMAAPLDLCLTLRQEDLDRLTQTYRPDIALEVTQDDRILARWQRHPDWGHLEVEAGADGTRVWIRPRRLVRGSRALDAVRRIPPVAFRLPLPAERVKVLSVEAKDGAVELRGQVDELRIPLGSAGPEQLLRRMDDLRFRAQQD